MMMAQNAKQATEFFCGQGESRVIGTGRSWRPSLDHWSTGAPWRRQQTCGELGCTPGGAVKIKRLLFKFDN